MLQDLADSTYVGHKESYMYALHSVSPLRTEKITGMLFHFKFSYHFFTLQNTKNKNFLMQILVLNFTINKFPGVYKIRLTVWHSKHE